MKLSNIKPDDKMRIPKFVKLDTNSKVPRYNTECEIINAHEYAKNLINEKPRKGWELVL